MSSLGWLYNAFDQHEHQYPGWMTPDLHPDMWTMVDLTLTDLDMEEYEELDSTGEDAGWSSVAGQVTTCCTLEGGLLTVTREVRVAFSGIARPMGSSCDYEVSSLEIVAPVGYGIDPDDL